MSGNVKYTALEGVSYIGSKNDMGISNDNSQLNSIFNLNAQQSAYFTLLIEGFEYSRYHTSYMSTTKSANDGRRDNYFNRANNAFTYGRPLQNTGFDNFNRNASLYWMPLKSLNYTQGSIETANISTGVFADLQLPFRKHSPVLSIETYDDRSDFFEMKLREWHNMSVLTEGFVPVLESICKKVHIRSWSTNGECNSITECQCILTDDISVTRSYEENGLKVVSFKLTVVGWGGGK